MSGKAGSASDAKSVSPGVDCLLLADWLPPDFGAIGQYALQYAETRAASGQSVCLVGFSSSANSRVVHRVGSGELSITRIRRPSYDRSSLPRRALWTIAANLHLLWAARSSLRSAREVIFTGSPPYLLHFIAPLKWLIRGRLRYRIADFHPECLIAAVSRPSPLLKVIERMTWFWRRRVDVLEIIAEDQRSRLLANGIKPDHIEIRRDRSPVSFIGTSAANPPANLAGRKIILYSGNWGVAHDSDTFLAGLARIPESDRHRFGIWLNATGARSEAVREAATSLGIAVAHTEPCALDQLPGVLLAADLHLITLADAFVGLVLPSKVYACIDSGRPILFVGSSCSDVHTLISEQRDGSDYRRASIGEPERVAECIHALLFGGDS